MAWVAVAQTTTSWLILSDDAAGWILPGLTPLLTEDGLLLLTEGDGPLCIEASTAPPSSNWVPL